MSTWIGLIALAVAVLLIVQVLRFAWRFFLGKEEMVAGGSWGKQLFGSRKERKRDAP